MNADNYWKKFGREGEDQVILGYGERTGYIIQRITDDVRIKGISWVEDQGHAVAAYSAWVRYFQRKRGNPEGILPK